DNVLVIAPGVLSGTSAPTSGRLSVGCKSPLTNGIKEANAGGNPGQHLMKLGVRAIVVTGQPADRNRRYGLEITADGARVLPADEYKGLWNYPTCAKLLANYPKTASAISIGPAGELMLRGASVACTDQSKNRHPARHAARGGPGAVMGSKCLKWIAIDPGHTKALTAADDKAFTTLSKSFAKSYLASQTYQMFKFGTSSVVPIANMLYTFPYKNRTEGRNPEFEKLDGANIVKSFETRGGGMHNCMSGCIVRCSNIVNDKDGNYLTSALEFETLTLLGSSCAINDWEAVGALDRLCDEVGLDTIETGAAIAVLMDSGGMQWGDAAGAKRLLEGIAQGDETALMIGNGAAYVGEKRKHGRVPVVKGQALPAWDPRPLKAAGVTYASSAMGADHTAGLVIDPKIGGAEAAQASRNMQIACAVTDSSGFCMFLSVNLDQVREFYTHFLGEQVSREQILDVGWQCLQDEWEFNRRAGFTQADDDLPDCMRNEGVGPDGSMKFDVSAADIQSAKQPPVVSDALFSLGASG
ncbi:MAG: hypothetical protein K8F31_06365, partial [Roseovarius sp.]|nr:hypothetical protein [Roseovarius sp.]